MDHDVSRRQSNLLGESTGDDDRHGGAGAPGRWAERRTPVCMSRQWSEQLPRRRANRAETEERKNRERFLHVSVAKGMEETTSPRGGLRSVAMG
jgi:hypothetical protein